MVSMTEQPNALTPARGSDNAPDRRDLALFQQMQATSIKNTKVVQSVQEWESARKTLTNIQGLLVQAYHELESMAEEKS